MTQPISLSIYELHILLFVLYFLQFSLRAEPNFIVPLPNEVATTVKKEVSLSCMANSDVEWFFNGLPIQVSENRNVSGSSLTIKSVETSHKGFYQCRIGGTKKANKVTTTYLHVVDVELTKGIVVIPEAITCTVTNPVKVKNITWKKDGNILAALPSRVISPLFFNGYNTTSSLNLTSAESSDSGVYECVISLYSVDETFSETSKLTIVGK